MIPFMKGTLNGRVALVTGAGSGIGKASAKALAYAGAAVAVVGRTSDEIEVTRKEIGENGGDAIAVTADISSGADMHRAVEEIAGKYGHIDIVFANAGINGVWAPIESIEEKEWDQTLGINLKGTFLTIQQAAPYLKKNGGSVIITSSVNGNRIFSNTGATAYSCSKAGQVAMTKMLALELAKYKIRINVICPGAIGTRIDDSTDRRELEREAIPVEFPDGAIPLTGNTPGTSGQVAELVWFLASDASNHITGTEIYIDGGQSLLQG